MRMGASDRGFSLPGSSGVYACTHVLDDGMPILYVGHDDDGDWEFLCDGAPEDCDDRLVPLGDVLDRDDTVKEIADLGCGCSASREVVGGKWTVLDKLDKKVLGDIAEYGWHVVIVMAEGDDPGFAYSIGMKETLGHPEIIMFGLPGRLMGAVINDIGNSIRAGSPPIVGERVGELLEGADCILHPVDKSHYREYFGWALWYYQGDSFDALQCFWPGKLDGQFPWEPNSDEDVRSLQPDLREKRSGSS